MIQHEAYSRKWGDLSWDIQSNLETQNKVLCYESEVYAIKSLNFMTSQQMNGWGLNMWNSGIMENLVLKLLF